MIGIPTSFPADWYWAVGNKPGEVFSSARAAYVPSTDAAFLAWRTANPITTLRSTEDRTGVEDDDIGEIKVIPVTSDRDPSSILSDGELADVLLTSGLPAAAVIAAGATSLGGLSPAEAAAVMMAMGCAIVSTGTPALSGTYAVDAAAQQAITSESVYIQVTGSSGTAKFTNGKSSRGWPDATGVLHTFTTPQFIPFAEAIAEYVDALNVAAAMLAAGETPTWPAQPVTIA